MPELPEVETVRQGLAPTWVGNRITHVHLARSGLRWPFPEQFVTRLQGRTVTLLNRRAKYLLAHLDSDDVLLMHLGMSGAFRVESPQTGTSTHGKPLPVVKNPAHDHVIFTFADQSRTFYNDPRRFGFMDLLHAATFEQHVLLSNIGIEPLGNGLNGATLKALMGASRSALKIALLDQKRIAGLGNIYVCEALHRAHISPLRPANSLRDDEAEILASAIQYVLREAIAAGGSSLKDHTAADGSMGYFQHRFAVYDRAASPCPTTGCSGQIQRIVQAGRSTFWCEICQK